MAEIRTLKLNLLADVDQFGRGIRTAETNVKKFESTTSKATKMASAAFAALATSAAYAAVTIGKDAVKAAIEDQKSQRLLETQLKKTVKANDSVVQGVEKYISKTQSRVGVQDDKLRPSLARLVRSTEDVAKAQELMNIALDISAATGKDVDLVAAALGKTWDGSATSLSKLGLGIDSSILKSGDLNKILDTLRRNFGGFADQEAATFEGKVRKAKIAIDELKEGIGYLLLPQVEKFIKYANTTLIPTLQKISDGFQGIKSGSTDSAYQFGAAIKTLAASWSSLFKVFTGSGGGLFGAYLSYITSLMNRFNTMLQIVTATLNKAKQILGFKSSTVGAGYSESRDAARSAGRPGNLNVLTIPDPFGGGGNNGGGGGGSKASSAAEKRKKQIDDLAAAFKNYKDAIKGAITGTLDFASAFADKGTGSFMNALRGQAKLAYEFGGKISKLVQMGLSRGALSQIIAAGPVAGSSIASELLSGGAGAITETNQLVSGIEAFSNQVSQYATAGVSGRGTSSLGGNAINITINGAVDPQGTARALEKLFQDSARRAGALSFVGATL